MTYKKIKKILVSVVALAAVMGMGVIADAEIPEGLWEYDESIDDEFITLEFAEICVFLPVEWEDLYGMEIGKDYVEFYQEASREIARKEGAEGGGVLFTICYAQDYEFTEYLPDYEIIGSGSEGVYYVTQPTDVQCLGTTKEEWEEWFLLVDRIPDIIEDMIVLYPGEGLVMTAELALEDVYILPESSERVLEESELEGMTADEAQMAINEIYARNHRKFLWKNVQEYFDSKDWYEGTIEAKDFDPASMSYVEWQNIELLVKYIKGLNEALPNETEVSEPAEKAEITVGTEVTATVYLNLRELPSNQGKVLLVIPKGARLTARGKAENSWLPVAYNKEDGTPVWGFVWTAYVSPVVVIK